MDILLPLWIAIDIVLLILLLPIGKNVKKNANEMRRYTIESADGLEIAFMEVVLKVLWIIPVGLIAYVLIDIVSDETFQKFLRWYVDLFVLTLLPLLITWIKEKKFDVKSMRNWFLILLAVGISIVKYFIDIEKFEDVEKYRLLWNIVLTMQVVLFIDMIFDMRKEKKEFYSKKLFRKGIRKDLYYRTPRLLVNISKMELFKCCERYFNEYMRRYRKIKGLRTIEYVNLTGGAKETWYKKASCYMKIFVAVSVFAVIRGLLVGMSYKSLWMMGLIVTFEGLVIIYKYRDPSLLYILLIRYFYDEWGYYLTHAGGNKFVGIHQMVQLSKYHKYIHSLLDIVALCRAVAVDDKINGEKKICIIASDLSELFENYTDYKHNPKWSMIAPLWVAAMFEFYVTGAIGCDVKKVLKMSATEKTTPYISIFLQSFWADIEKKKIEDGILKYIQDFEDEIYA